MKWALSDETLQDLFVIEASKHLPGKFYFFLNHDLNREINDQEVDRYVSSLLGKVNNAKAMAKYEENKKASHVA